MLKRNGMVKGMEINNLKQEIRKLPLFHGDYKTNIPGVTAYRFTGEKIHMPQTKNPYLYIVVEGMLRLYTPSGIMDYMAGQYSVSKIDTPLAGTVLAVSEEQDFLAVSVEFTIHEVITTILDMDNSLTEKILNENIPEQDMTISDREVIRSVYRLFYAMQETIPSEFLHRTILRELIYYLLCGSCGK